MKKVSYITLLKEAIQEYDAKAMDKLGPMTEPILTYRGDGELKTHYDPSNLTSSVLERYYFNETKEQLVEMDEEDFNSQSPASKRNGPEHDAVDPNDIVTGEEADSVVQTMKEFEDEVLDEELDLDEAFELDEDPSADELISGEHKPFDEEGEQDILQASEKPLDDSDAGIIKHEDFDLDEDFELDEDLEVDEGIAGTIIGAGIGSAVGAKYGIKGSTEIGKRLGGAAIGGALGHLAQQRTKQAVYRPESISLEDTVINKLIQEMEAEDQDSQSKASKRNGPEHDAVDPNDIVTGEEAEATRTTAKQFKDEVLDEDLDEAFDLDEDFDLLEDDEKLEDKEEKIEKDDKGPEKEITKEDFDIDEDFNLDEDKNIDEGLELDEDFDLLEDDEAKDDEKEATGEGEEKDLDVDKKTLNKEGEGMGPIRIKKARELDEAFKIFKDEIDE